MTLNTITDGAKKLSQKVQQSAKELKKTTDKALHKVQDEAGDKAKDLAYKARGTISKTAKTIADKTR